MAASTVAFASPALRAPSRARARRASVGVRASADDQKRELAAMRAQVQMAAMNPSQENVISAILELANQEFGLTGVKFTEVMDKVNECYAFTPCQYTSGVSTPQETVNPAGTNSGSLKTYYFAHLHGLDEAATLRLFCEHYKDVLDTPDGDSHANIRAFMVNGWDGIAFEGEPLKLRDGTEVDDVDSV
jgi:hypothetical protein